jgi:hypothetical protein
MSDADFDRRLAALADLAGRAAVMPMADEIRRRARRRTIQRRTAAGAFVVALLVGGVFAGRQLKAPDESVGVTPSLSTATQPEASPLPSAPPPSSNPPVTPSTSPSHTSATAACKKASLSVTLGVGDAGAGHRSVQVVFRNIGTAPCHMRGYPGVDGLAADGTTIAHATRTMAGYMGGISGTTSPTATLRPGQSTYAVVEGTASTPDGSSCAGIKQLLIIAPDDTVPTKLPWDSGVCMNLEVHPITG